MPNLRSSIFDVRSSIADRGLNADVECRMSNVGCEKQLRPPASDIPHSTSHIRHGFSYVATCQPVLGWGAGIVSGSGQSAIGARNLDGHAAHEIVY
ncbi:MAG: hypothetical protein ACYC26_17165, partial [Phycisphaerales bacterium]